MKSCMHYKKLFWQTVRECKYLHLSTNRCKSKQYGGKLKQAHKFKTSGSKENERLPLRPFREIQSRRFDEAGRSVLVNLPRSLQEIHNTLDICSSCGKVQNVFRYQTMGTDNLLVEFQHKDSIHKLFKNVGFFRNNEQIPVKSRILYKQFGNNQKRHRSSLNIQQMNPVNFNLNSLSNKKCSLSKGMTLLYEAEKMTELDTRLRFFIVSTVEELISNTFPYSKANMFGSCVNGFGSTECDLDIEMDFTFVDIDREYLLRFKTRHIDSDPRRHSQQLLDAVGGILNILMPSAGYVQKILRARIPIVKFYSFAANIECDISVSNGSGSKMAELMYTWGELCPQIRPLVTVLKYWAKSKGLTNSINSGMSNVMLILMAVFYLQIKSLLPTFQHMQQIADDADKFIIDEINYSFCTDLNKLKQENKDPDLGELLIGFFNFYSTFNFNDKAISVIVGDAVNKSSDKPMHIENPLDVDHNVSKNVSDQYLDAFIMAVQEGSSILGEAKSDSILNDLIIMKRNSGEKSTSNFNISNLFSNTEEENGEMHEET